MVHWSFVECYRARGLGKGGKSRGLSRGDQLLGRPDVVWGSFSKKISPVAGFPPLDALK